LPLGDWSSRRLVLPQTPHPLRNVSGRYASSKAASTARRGFRSSFDFLSRTVWIVTPRRRYCSFTYFPPPGLPISFFPPTVCPAGSGRRKTFRTWALRLFFPFHTPFALGRVRFGLFLAEMCSQGRRYELKDPCFFFPYVLS